MLIGQDRQEEQNRQDMAKQGRGGQNKTESYKIGQGRVKQVDITGLQKKQTLQRNVCFLMYIKDDQSLSFAHKNSLFNLAM